MMLHTGEPAPDFSLYNSEKKLITLSDYRGKKVLLLFFPLAFTSTCTEELCSVRDNIAVYNKLESEVFGISVDSLYSLARYKQEQQLNFSLLSDFNKTVSIAYGTLYESFGFNMKGVSKRSAFVIDREGILRWSEVLENAGKVPDFKMIEKKLQEIL